MRSTFFFLPIVLLGLMVVHFPRFLVFDVPMVMAVSGAVMLTGGVFPIDLGTKFVPTSPPGITVPEWYLTGLYAFLRTGYDKFVTGVAWPGLLILTLAIMPFIDRYKKFSWKDRPLVTAIGITSIAQIAVTTYWGFYIDPNIQKSLLERLVIDPIFLYSVMLMLVPLSFGFTYLIIKLAKNAEANAKLQPKKPSGKSSINIPESWIYIVFVALFAFQIYLNIAAYYAVLNGMKNFSLFIVGIIMIVFAAMFHVYRHGKTMAKQPTPKPIAPPAGAKPIPYAPSPTPPIPTTTTKPLSAPPSSKSAATTTQAPAHGPTHTKGVSSREADIAAATDDVWSQKTPSSATDTAADLNGNGRDTKKIK
jgi:ubiquinol-cytochrome c reductase cytochrome b subunit